MCKDKIGKRRLWLAWFDTTSCDKCLSSKQADQRSLKGHAVITPKRSSFVCSNVSKVRGVVRRRRQWKSAGIKCLCQQRKVSEFLSSQQKQTSLVVKVRALSIFIKTRIFFSLRTHAMFDRRMCWHTRESNVSQKLVSECKIMSGSWHLGALLRTWMNGTTVMTMENVCLRTVYPSCRILCASDPSVEGRQAKKRKRLSTRCLRDRFYGLWHGTSPTRIQTQRDTPRWNVLGNNINWLHFRSHSLCSHILSREAFVSVKQAQS